MAKPQVSEASSQHSTISRDEILARLKDRALVIVNVMPRETYEEGHIPGSINLPVAEIEANARQLISNSSQEIAIYCAGST
jgi:rhodanese-related sulfurtransferase